MLTSSGAVQWPNWELLPHSNDSCLPTTKRSVPCAQGRVPLYAVPAKSADDIQAAINFARERNVKLVIKNTGHDFLGRSTAAGALSIWTHFMKDISFASKFTPSGCYKSAPEHAVTIGAGVQLHELYQAVAAKGRIVVAGSASTVGAAGGYVQGGGHSALGVWKGMSADNILQFTVVTADVRIHLISLFS
jgi:FAD/FMN-containing dehydrogenase